MGKDRFPVGSGEQWGAGAFDDILRRIAALEQWAIRNVTGAQLDSTGNLHIDGVPDTAKGDMLYNDGTGLVKLAAPTLDFLTAGRDEGDPADASIFFNHETMLPEWRQTSESCSE
jgi:hypothetical protein